MAKDSSHWIEDAHLHKGALREKTDTKEGKDISAKRLHAAAHSKNSTTRHQAQLAETLKSLKK